MYTNVKKILMLTAVMSMLLFAACTDDEPKGTAYRIETTIDGIPDGVRAFLKVPNERNQPMPKDTAIVQNGKFVFTGNAPYPEMAYVYVNGANGSYPVILEPGTISVEAYKDSLPSSVATGAKHNDVYAAFIKDSKDLARRIKKARERYAAIQVKKDTAAIKAIRKDIDALQQEGADYQKAYIRNNPDAYISIPLVQRMLNMKAMTPKQVQEFYNTLPEDMKKTKAAEQLFIKFNDMMRGAVGEVAPPFKARTPEGETVALSDVKGKVTVIDFWAAWCKPCRLENPNMVKLYEKYHKDGLEIIGVSLDGRPNQNSAMEDWKKAIEDDGLTWTQVSNLAGFKDGIARTYNVRAIPATFILNEEGVIVAKNLRGDRLEAKVKELLDK